MPSSPFIDFNSFEGEDDKAAIQRQQDRSHLKIYLKCSVL